MEDFELVESLDHDADFSESMSKKSVCEIFVDVFIDALIGSLLEGLSNNVRSRRGRTSRDKLELKP